MNHLLLDQSTSISTISVLAKYSEKLSPLKYGTPPVSLTPAAVLSPFYRRFVDDSRKLSTV
jgi:hypothetical protein